MFLDQTPAYSLDRAAKQRFLSAQLAALVARHAAGCPPYARVVEEWQRRHAPPSEATPIEDFPYIPVNLFKEFDLVSTTEKVMSVQSSATTTGKSSKVFTDKSTRRRQTLSAAKIWNDFIGETRRPCLVFDLEATVRGNDSLGARAAAILSLAHHASSWHFVMRADGDALRVDVDALRRALDETAGKPILCYGFTYLLYLAHRELIDAGFAYPLHPDSLFLHSGGWKRLIDQSVEKPAFNRTIAAPWDVAPSNVIDFYGTVEQVGMLYPDCREGLKHVPYWADVVLRRPDSLEPAPAGETGLIQLVSALPLAAPNHSVLTEDLGALVAVDGCACGRRGNAFVFKGRAPKSEVRGCSDVARH
jgi:phenylacetate-coenzyme A ligase PaaK-like adenylate-forming protein